MAAAKGRALNLEPEPTPQQAAATLNQLVFVALPAPLFHQLSDEAAKRQMTLSQFMSTAMAEFLLKPADGKR